MSLLPADLELLDHELWTHEAIPTVKDEGAGLDVTKRQRAARVSTDIDLDMLETTIEDFNLRHYLIRLWRTWHTDEAPSAQYQGTASLDPGVLETYVRAGDSWIENPAAAKAGVRSLIKVGGDVQRLAPDGLLIEPARTNLILNPAFKTGIATSWTTSATANDLTEVITDADDSPQSAKITRVGAGTARIEQGTLSMVASTAYFLSLYHKDDSAVKLQIQVIRASDGFYWLTGSTWQAGAAFQDVTIRAAAARDYIGPIVKDGATGNVTVKVIAESGSGQINHVYQVQLEAGRSATSPILVGAVARAKDDLKIENFTGKRVLDVLRGDGDIVHVPNANSADLAGGTVLTLLDAYFDASNYMRLLYDVTAGAVQFISRVAGTSYTASKTVTLTRGTPVVIGFRWVSSLGEEGLAPYTISLFVNGVKGTDAIPSGVPTMTASPYLYIGQDQSGANQADGALRYLKIRPFVMSDDEHVDYP